MGVDGGGTKTEAVLIDDEEKVVAQGQASGSNPGIIGLEKAVENVYSSVKNFTDGLFVNSACFAIAGVNTKDDEQKFEKTILNHPKLSKIVPKFFVVNDTYAALRAGTDDKNAVVIIAGTGSNCYGRNENGKEAKSGGFDYILSDEGSGYAIGLSVLKACVKALDGRDKRTSLVNLLFKNFKLTSLDDLAELVYRKPWNKTDIAGIAPLAEMAAEENDEIAQKIIKEAAHDLGLMIKAVVDACDLAGKSFTIVTAGSVFNIQKILCQHLEEDVLAFSPKAVFVKSKLSSAYGAALLAKEMEN